MITPRDVGRLETRLWANDEQPSLDGYRQLAFDAILLLKDAHDHDHDDCRSPGRGEHRHAYIHKHPIEHHHDHIHPTDAMLERRIAAARRAPVPQPRLLVPNPWRDLAHDLRTFAAHAPGCEYQPTYPETGDTTCSCGFDDVLDGYDRRSAE